MHPDGYGTAIPSKAMENTEAVRQSHVIRELEDQPKLIAGIQQAINDLELRLVGVLRSEDTPEKMAGEPHEVLVPIADQLHEHNVRLRINRDRLQSILGRLEL